MFSFFILSFFLLLFYRLVFNQKNKKFGHWLIPLIIWISLAISCSLILTEIFHHSYFFLGPLFFFLLFFVSYRQKKARLMNGLYFNLFLASYAGYLIYHLILTRSLIGSLFIIAIALLGLFYALFGTWSLILLLYWNALIVWRREKVAIGNLLTLLVAVLLTFLLIYDHFIVAFIPEWLAVLFSFFPLAIFYFALIFLNFLTIAIIYQFNFPTYEQDFIIVLGAGLLNGEKVTPLLASRVDRALQFYHQQKKESQKVAKLIFSGGQGPDEKISEAQAMKNYALQKGIPETDMLLEEQSTTTFENMKFSKEIITKSQLSEPKTIFSSNNYHIFRAAIFAQQNHLKADGIGAKTAKYFLPNAFLREFIALIAMNKRKHFFFLVFLLLTLMLLAWASYINTH